ncbi:MAG: FecR domain-containing protein [Treponema sp.]|nr:FecR domain-containing protein [Treponema sp.]
MKKILVLLAASLLAHSAFSMQATVVSAKGKAEVENGGSWIALKEGDQLEQGAVIQTGFKSEVVLKIKESTVTVAPLSRITLKKLVEREGLNGAKGKDETSIFLDTGSLKSNVQKSADRRVGFTVRSPVATASVRGTEFTMGTKFRAASLSTSRGLVAFWKNTRQSESIMDNASDTPVEEASEGNEAGDISEYAPQGALVVAAGTQSSVSESRGAESPFSVAKSKSEVIGPASQSGAEAEHSGNTPAAFTEDRSSGGKGPKVGSLTVTVGFSD